MTEDKTTIRVAKITALQAVVVAAVTAVSGGIGGCFLSNKTVEVQSQDWLTIRGAEWRSSSPDSPIPSSYRILITADTVKFSYPSTALWQAVGSDAPPQRFPLPSGLKEHEITFEVLFPTGKKGVYQKGVSTEVHRVIAPSQIVQFKTQPVTGITHTESAPFMTRGVKWTTKDAEESTDVGSGYFVVSYELQSMNQQ